MLAVAIKQSFRQSAMLASSLNGGVAKSAFTRFFSEYKKVRAAIDGNEAAASSAYNVSDAAILYPISPSSPMGEHADAWAVKGRKNIFGNVLRVTEMQSEGGAAGALHGALVGGLLGTTFTSSQGMMLMIPNMYRIAGGLLPAVIHVASRVVSKQALSLLCEHSDVMATRQTGFAILSSHCVQEAHDLALVAHLSAITTSIPFLHFFDGWRVSHEVNSIDTIPCEEVAKIYPYEDANIFRKRALNPNHPYQRGIAQSQDIYMQNCIRCSREDPGGHGQGGEHHGSSVPSVRLRWSSRRGARDRGDGRRNHRGGDGELSEQAGREGGCGEGASVPPLLAEALGRRHPQDGEERPASRCTWMWWPR